MRQDTNRLLLFRQEPEHLMNEILSAREDRGRLTAAFSRLLTLAYRRGWQGNLWQRLLTDSLIGSENPFSLSCERQAPERGSLWALALQDMALYADWFALSFDHPAWEIIRSFFRSSAEEANSGAERLSDALAGAASPGEMLSLLAAYYRAEGCGIFGAASVFQIRGEEDSWALIPSGGVGEASFDTLVGYESQKQLLRENTEAFLAGHHANNVLLYGDAGTGKSTSIQALAGAYADRGLRIVQIYKSQFSYIPAVLERLRGRCYRFILLLDDLSFEETEHEYKFLKAVMEGGAAAAPENVRIYATSNRRHLVRETWGDRRDMEHHQDVHRSDTMEEKLSLAGRFGLQIFYPAPDFTDYQRIVSVLAGRHGVTLDGEELRRAAAAWQVRTGSRSGRTAKQLIDSLIKS